MSLLLDALRRAEAAKRRHVEAEESAPAGQGFPALDAEVTAPVSADGPALSTHESAPPVGVEESPSWTLADTVEPAAENPPTELTLEAPVLAPSPAAEVASTRPAAVPAEAAVAASPSRKPLFEKAAPSLSIEPQTATPLTPGAATVKPASAGPIPPSPAERDKRETAKRVVAAAQRPRAPLNRTLLLALGGGVAVLGAAAYLWWQMQPPGSVALFGSTAPPTSVAASDTATDASPAPAPAGTAEQATAAKPSPAEAQPAGTPAMASPSASANARDKAAAPEGPPAMAAVAKAAVSVPTPTPPRERSEPATVRFVPSQSEQTVMQPVRRGYAAYQAGNLQAATTAYQEALSDDPASRDAMLGLAAIAARQGRMAEAQHWYQRVLAANPQDPDAQAGLAAVGRSQQPAEREARLRGLIEAQPERAELVQELAGLYASQQRWGDAQQSYFRAFTLDQDNPDAAFNLAVSLEHIDQPKAALDYYRKALALAERRTPRFLPAAAEQRIAALTREGAAKQ